MCQFHWELDCVGFSPFEIWRCGCVEMMRGIGGDGFLFSILGYCRSIARVSPDIRELSCLVLSYLVLSCLVAAAAAAAAAAATAATAAGSSGPVAAAYLHTTELRAPQGAAPYLWLVASL